MNWRVLTAINAAIALVTVSAVIFDLTRSRDERAHTTVRSNPTSEQSQAAEREAKARVEALEDISQARVDDLGSVPAGELTQLMNRATPEQLAAMAFKFNDAPTDSRTFGGMGVFFQAWTELDPKAALTGAFQLRDVTMRKLAATAVVNSTSPSAAPELITMLTQHPDKDLLSECKNTFLDPLIASWSSLDPEAASKFVDELGNAKSSLNSTARNNIAYNWGTLDPSGALEWVRKQDGKEYVDRGSLTDGVIRGWCLKDIRAASDYVVQHLDDPASRTTASSVAEAMFAHNAEDATNWIGRLPPGDPRDAAESADEETFFLAAVAQRDGATQQHDGKDAQGQVEGPRRASPRKGFLRVWEVVTGSLERLVDTRRRAWLQAWAAGRMALRQARPDSGRRNEVTSCTGRRRP